jgi:hypothetical protein
VIKKTVKRMKRLNSTQLKTDVHIVGCESKWSIFVRMPGFGYEQWQQVSHRCAKNVSQNDNRRESRGERSVGFCENPGSEVE